MKLRKDILDLDFLDRLGTDSLEAHLKGTDSLEAHLKGTDSLEAHLKGTDSLEAHLKGTDSLEAHLKFVGLRQLLFSVVTTSIFSAPS